MAPPRHIAVIPDGNRRWARARGLEPVEGHRAGLVAMTRIASAAWDAGVEVFTFRWGSPANLTLRSTDEVAHIVGGLAEWLSGPASSLLERYDAHIDVIGRWPEICPSLLPAVDRARASSGGGPRRLVVLMAYDGQEEILSATERADGTPEGFEAALWTGHLPPADLVLRTGGEPHLSAGFLLWQIANAQLAFLPIHWPAMTPEDLARALEEYSATERRFGA